MELVGEPGFVAGESGSGVVPAGEDEGGGRGGVGVFAACECGLEALPFGAGLAEGAQGGGVAAGLGGEVAPEAEHVCPGAEAEVGEVGAGAEVPAGADEAAGVVGEVGVGEFGQEPDAVVEGAGRGLGALGGVLGDVAGHGAVGEFGAAREVGGADDAYVELAAEGEPVRVAVEGRARDGGGSGGGFDGVGEELRGGPCRGWGVGAVVAVESDDGVEVDGAASLVLGDLGEGDAGVLAEGALGESGALGDLAAEVDGEAPPQSPGVGVPEHRGFVVVGVGVERCSEGGIVGGVGGAASAGGSAGGAVVDGAEAGCGEGREDAGVCGDLFVRAFAAA